MFPILEQHLEIMYEATEYLRVFSSSEVVFSSSEAVFNMVMLVQIPGLCQSNETFLFEVAIM